MTERPEEIEDDVGPDLLADTLVWLGQLDGGSRRRHGLLVRELRAGGADRHCAIC